MTRGRLDENLDGLFDVHCANFIQIPGIFLLFGAKKRVIAKKLRNANGWLSGKQTTASQVRHSFTMCRPADCDDRFVSDSVVAI